MAKDKVIETTNKNMVAGIDLNKLIKTAQDSYEKKEGSLARQLSTGSTINKSNDDKDYVVWTAGPFWQELTHLKGLPFGRICQISGKSDSGKSSCAMQFMKFAQDQNVLVVLWDAERKFSAARYDKKIGGRSDQLIAINTNNIVEGARAVAQVVHAAKEQNPNVKILIVWDSVGSSVNSKEDQEDSESIDKQPGVTAREISWAVRKFNKLAGRYMNKETGEETIAVLCLNQVYSSIGQMGPPTQIEKGGVELYYLSSIIIQLSRKKDLTRVKGGIQYKFGIISKAKIKKNHLADGTESVASLDICVSAAGVQLADEVKSFDDIQILESEDEDELDGE